MLSLPPSVRIWLGSQTVDMRRGHDGLRAVVEQVLERDPYSGHLFVFLGKRLDRVKVFWWDQGGFVLYYKRLEKGRFRIPTLPSDREALSLDGTQRMMLLDGIDLSRVRRPAKWSPKRRSPRNPSTSPPPM